MSENIPESVPTSQDPRSKRPLKRRALSPSSKQASEVEALFANPEHEVTVSAGNALSKKSALAPPPEIVANVQGSSAGAGSGEFHVYKASRRREYERLKMMDEENARELAEAEFERTKEENKAKDESKTEKNRKKREKQRQRKAKGRANQNGNTPTDGKSNAPHAINGHGGDEAMKVKDGGSTTKANDVPMASGEATGLIIHDDE